MVDLRLNTLTVVKKADLVGRDEPMLWTMFIEISLEAVNSRQFVVTTDPIASKLGKAGKGDSLPIPASVGHFHRESGVGFVGVAVMGFDNDRRSDAQIRNGYAAGAAALNQAIVEHFPKHGVAQIEAAEQAEINAKVRQAIVGAFLETSVIRTLFGGTPVGGGSFTKTLTNPSIDEAVTLTLHAKNDRAIYRVDGRLQSQH